VDLGGVGEAISYWTASSVSCWVRQPTTILWFDGNVLEWTYYAGGYNARLTTTAVYRDFSAWMHVVFALDTSQATANSRMRLYVNGVEVTTFTNRTNPSLNDEYGVNSTVAHQIGFNSVAGGYYFNGYLADIHFIDGQALDPSSFGEFDTNGVWQPIDASGLTYGTNGFRLPFSDNSTAAALGTDTSGNGNDWTVNNISVAPTSINTSQKWSGLLSASGGSGFTNQGAGGFAGYDDASNYTYVTGASSGTNYTITLTPASTISFTTSLVVRVESGQGEVTINGGTTWVADTGGLVTFIGPGSFSAITVRDKRGQYSGEFHSVKVDGVLLVDPGALSYVDSLVDSPTNYGTDTGAGGEVRGNYCTWNPLYSAHRSLTLTGTLTSLVPRQTGSRHNRCWQLASGIGKQLQQTVRQY
jgi:hypothetical protein